MTTVPGTVVWFTGLPQSGKTTLAHRVRDRLRPHPSVLLDSDELRAAFGSADYTPAGRDRFYATLGELAILLARQGLIVLVAATAPKRAYRDDVRARVTSFVEVWIRASAAVCEARDRKELYVRARAGSAPDLPGVGVPYEEPLMPEIIASGGDDAAAVDAILARL